MGFKDIQQGLAAAALTIDGLNAFPALPDAITPPTFAPIEFTINYDQTFGHGLRMITHSCGIYVPNNDAGHLDLSDFLEDTGPTSIKAAIEADLTLGGTAKTLSVVSVTGAYRLYTIGGTDYLGAVFNIQVWS